MPTSGPSPVSPGGPLSTLPVEATIEDLRSALRQTSSAVLQAPPGAGKTTIVPLRLLAEPWLDGQRIVMLEPRRLAARAAARRMADLLGEEVGRTVGYRTRDERHVGRDTRIEVVTEGILTRRLQRDPSLPGTRTGDLRRDPRTQPPGRPRPRLHPRRPRRAAPRPADPGHVGHPRHRSGGGGDRPRPTGAGDHERWPYAPRRHPMASCRSTTVVDRRASPRRRRPRCSTRSSTTRATSSCSWPAPRTSAGSSRCSGADGRPDDVDVRVLFGALSLQEQDLALAPSPAGRRRVVLATDIAETSLTVEGIRVVIDSGQVRSPHYDSRSGLTRLRTGANSRASAEQRAGRAGRVEPGVAYRLWSKMEQATRRPHADPEIVSVDLTGFALELAVWGTSADDLTFLDPPPRRSLDDARSLLHDLGALDADGRVTDAGRSMSELPVHPRLARMVTAGADLGFGSIACSLAAMLEERDVLRGRARRAADQHRRPTPTRRRHGDGPSPPRSVGPASRPTARRRAGPPGGHRAGRSRVDRSDDRGRVGPGPRLPRPRRAGPRQRPVPHAPRRRSLAARG